MARPQESKSTFRSNKRRTQKGSRKPTIRYWKEVRQAAVSEHQTPLRTAEQTHASYHNPYSSIHDKYQSKERANTRNSDSTQQLDNQQEVHRSLHNHFPAHPSGRDEHNRICTSHLDRRRSDARAQAAAYPFLLPSPTRSTTPRHPCSAVLPAPKHVQTVHICISDLRRYQVHHDHQLRRSTPIRRPHLRLHSCHKSPRSEARGESPNRYHRTCAGYQTTATRENHQSLSKHCHRSSANASRLCAMSSATARPVIQRLRQVQRAADQRPASPAI